MNKEFLNDYILANYQWVSFCNSLTLFSEVRQTTKIEKKVDMVRLPDGSE